MEAHRPAIYRARRPRASPLWRCVLRHLPAHRAFWFGWYSAFPGAGRRWPIGCVSLEVTQRCNLDCTLCYLSEHAETVRDLPLEEIWTIANSRRDR